MALLHQLWFTRALATMTFPAGTRVGNYEILRPLSSGGNAQVFVGWDPGLQREVALKVLSGTSVWDLDQLQRLQREARILAQLNHPGILQVLDLVQFQEQPVLVTELLRGKTLRAALGEGRMAVDQAIQLVTEVAEALGVAHAKGIIHRDIKPENLFITTEGRCKVLDFGLAKPLRNEDNLGLDGAFETSSGMLQGTVGYLSPEQIGGQAVDARSDIYACGLVLWELLTGRPPGTGATALERQIALLRDGPGSLGTLSGADPALESLLHRCLEVNPGDRFPDTVSLIQALKDLPRQRADWPRPSRLRWRALRLLGVGVLLGAAVVAAIGWKLHRTVPLPDFKRLTFRQGNVLRARFMPGGKGVVLGAAWDGLPGELYRLEADGEVRALGVTGADILAVSRSGELAVLLKDRYQFTTLGLGTLARFYPGQEAPRALMDEVTGADWDSQGQDLVVTRRLPEGAFVLEYPVGRELYRTQTPLGSPRFSPDGQTIAFMGTSPLFTVFLWEQRRGVRTLLEQVQASDPILSWMPSGQEVVFAGNTHFDWMPPIMAVDLRGRIRYLARFPLRALLHDVAPDGRMLLEREFFRLDLHWVAGKQDREISWLDGSQVAALDARHHRVLFTELFEAVNQRPQVFIRDLAGGAAIRLGYGTAQDLSPEGDWALAITSEPDSVLRIFPIGKGVPRDLPLKGWLPMVARFRPGHPDLLVLARKAQGAVHLLLASTAGGAPTLVIPEPVIAMLPAPDGQQVLVQLASGGLEVVDLEGGGRHSAPSLRPSEELLAWPRRGASVLVAELGSWPIRVERLELATGQRHLDRETPLLSAIGAARVDRLRMSPDGQILGYSLLRVTMSDLIMVEGLQ